MAEKRYWLVKSEPETYGIDHLKKDKKTPWTGVRNFQARNFMRDDMQIGDEILYYHSNCKEPGVYGVAKVVSKSHPDETQFDPKSDYYEKRATKEKPVWFLVDIAFVQKFTKPVLLTHLRDDAKTRTMQILRPGSRLSVTPVTREEFDRVLTLAA